VKLNIKTQIETQNKMKKVLKSNSILYLIIMLWAFEANGQLVKTATETTVNSTITSNQQRPAVAIDNSGNYVVVWESQGQDGDGYGIYGQVYDNTGTVQKSEFLVNTTTSNDQRFADVATDSDGDFVIVWQSYSQDGDNWGIYFQRYNSSNVADDSETLVNSTTTGRQCMPKVAMDNSGNFAITWENGEDIYAATYDASGTVILSEFQVNTTTTNVQGYPDIAVDSDGDFVITWQSYDQDGDGFGVYFQRYDASAIAIGSETIVNTTTTRQQINPSISLDENGNFIIVWTDNTTDGNGEGVFGQLFNADGTTNGNEFQVNTTTSNMQNHPQVAMTTGGAFSVVWSSYGQDGQYTGIYNQSYNTDGSTSGSETLVNTTTNYFQQFPAIDLWSNSEAVIVWQDGQFNETNSLDTDGYGVVFQRYDAAVLPVELLYFYAEKVDEGVQLDWQTVTEINNSHFDIEWSKDGISFEKIGEVAGAGTTNEVQFYEFLHKLDFPSFQNLESLYYRLKQFDFDGSYIYSDIVNITIEEYNNLTINIYPNPTTDFITIENALVGENIQIFSANGRLVKNIQASNTKYQISIHDLPKGTYFIKIRETVKRILIQ
jgi:hypothetical protein